MTPDDFKQKCDEIHTILCYFDDNSNVPIADVFNSINVWFGHIDLSWLDFMNCSVLECAVKFLDKRNEIANMKEEIEFSSNRWTMV